VRAEYTAGEVRRFAKRAKDAAQARRLLAIAAVLDGASRTEAAKIGGMDRQTLRDWVIRFNDQGPDGLINIPSPGVPPGADSSGSRRGPIASLRSDHATARTNLSRRGPNAGECPTAAGSHPAGSRRASSKRQAPSRGVPLSRPYPAFTECAPDDRKCEVEHKLKGRVSDPLRVFDPRKGVGF
jgi:hypothetical protein